MQEPDVVDFADLRRRMEGAIAAFKGDIAALRTGRASANLLDPVSVDAYGSRMPLDRVANISVPEPRMLTVTVWDKSMVSAVEKAIRDSNLGFNPVTDGIVLRLVVPELTEERRRELAKLAHGYAENGRIAIRHVRRDGMDSLKKAEKAGVLGKDEHHVQAGRVQKLTDEMIAEVDRLADDKEKEIMQV